MDQNKVGNFIKHLRKQNHLTQKEFADLFGVTYQAVSKWENGLNIPDIAILKEISNKFNVDINDLLDGEVKKKKNVFKYVLVGALLVFIVGFVLILDPFHESDFTLKRLEVLVKILMYWEVWLIMIIKHLFIFLVLIV